MNVDVERGVVICAVMLVQANVRDISSFEGRSDEWWDLFWHYYGYYEAKWLRAQSKA